MTTWLIPEGLDHVSQATERNGQATERNRSVFKFLFIFIDDLYVSQVTATYSQLRRSRPELAESVLVEHLTLEESDPGVLKKLGSG